MERSKQTRALLLRPGDADMGQQLWPFGCLFLWHFHFIFNCTLVIMALKVLFCIYLMVLWWQCGDTFYFIRCSIRLNLLSLCFFLFYTEYLLYSYHKNWVDACVAYFSWDFFFLLNIQLHTTVCSRCGSFRCLAGAAVSSNITGFYH